MASLHYILIASDTSISGHLLTFDTMRPRAPPLTPPHLPTSPTLSSLLQAQPTDLGLMKLPGDPAMGQLPCRKIVRVHSWPGGQYNGTDQIACIRSHCCLPGSRTWAELSCQCHQGGYHAYLPFPARATS